MVNNNNIEFVERDSIKEDVERLTEIKESIIEQMQEAKNIFSSYGETRERFNRYPYGNIMVALHDDNEFVGKAMFSFEDCINELGEEDEDDTN